MKLLTTIAAVLISVSAYSQESITRGQDTIAYTSPQGEIYNISIYNDLTAEELHYITSEYRNNNFTFRDNEDLRLTMSRYMEDGSVTANWELTQNEQRLLNKYNVLAKQSNKSSSPTSKNNVTVREYLQVEYNEGTFSENGEELSLEQIKHLTLRYQTGIGDFRKGNYFNRMHMDGDRGIGYTAANFIGGAAAGAAGGFGVLYGGVIIVISTEYIVALPLGVVVTAGGAGLCVLSYKAFSRIFLSKKGCLKRRDRQFNKVADSLNQAIKAANP